MTAINSETDLAALAWGLAGSNAPYTSSERKLFASNTSVDAGLLQSVRALIQQGSDPLGEVYCRLRSAAQRRATGAIYTPAAIIVSMIAWAARQGMPARIVDPGCGSGRFTLAAARRFPNAGLVAVDTDPLAILMLRANAAVLGFAERLTARCADYRQLSLPAVDGRTLYIGNPPYVRHHQIAKEHKAWFAETAAEYGLRASTLAGLHIHFFLKTRQLARSGDFGAFITSAEWLDVNYGAILRSILANGLGGAALHVLTPQSMPFADTATTAAIACFRIGRRPGRMILRSVDSLAKLENLTEGKTVAWSTLEKARRWTPLIKPVARTPPGFVELGELCRVHRGQVTGANDVWISGAYPGALPETFLFPTVTKARELFAAGSVLESDHRLRRVIDLPADLDWLDVEDRKRVDLFLKWARERGAHESYIASNRRAWWSVGLRAPAPILCTYMARRPPAFVRNLCRAQHLNIAHGLYPRDPWSDADLIALVVYLSSQVRTDSGRTYAGGLTKFEPKELERVAVPRLEKLHDITNQMDGTAVTRRRRKGEGHISLRAS